MTSSNFFRSFFDIFFMVIEYTSIEMLILLHFFQETFFSIFKSAMLRFLSQATGTLSAVRIRAIVD